MSQTKAQLIEGLNINTSAPADALVIDSSGNVGIGGSPSDSSGSGYTTLTINNATTGAILDLEVNGTRTGTFLASATQVQLGTKTSALLRFDTNSTERMRIDSSGRLLLGTTTEGESGADDLTIATSSTTGITIRSGTSNAGNIYFSDGTSGAAEYRGQVSYLHNADSLVFATDASERMRIDSSGRLLLGTTTEGHPNLDDLTIATTGHTGITIRSGTSHDGQIGFSDGTSGDDEYRGQVLYNHGSNSMRFITDAIERLRIDSSGDVGIGITSPGEKLDVDGKIRSNHASDSRFLLRVNDVNKGGFQATTDAGVVIYGASSTNPIKFQTSGSERMRIESNGFVKAKAGYFYVQTSNSGTGNSDGLALIVDGNTDAYVWNHENTSLRFATNNTERMRLDSSGRLLVNKSTHSGDALFVVESNHTSGGIIGEFDNNDSGNFGGVRILGGVTDRECRLQSLYGNSFFTFYTEGSGAATERVRITKEGYLKAADNATYVDGGSAVHEFNQSSTTEVIQIRSTNTSYGSTIVNLFAVRAATSAYWFIRGLSSSGSASADTEFYIRGDGNAFADGSWTGGGADYAEYFEWSDGNTEAADRRGISVVLDGDKIREAVDGEEPIGVISGNPSVVGDGDVDRWKGKYLRDDYGSYVLDGDGYRQLNPDYDSSVEYVQREDRPEWDTVGLMGKLRIRKGQVTGTRWIKMRDVSDTVEEWLVR